MRGIKSTAFPAPISRNSLMCTCGTEFNPNLTNVEKVRAESITPLNKASLILPRFLEGDPHFCRQMYLHITRRSTKNTGKVTFTPVSTAWLSPNRFPRDIQLLNSIRWRMSIPNFTQIGQCIWSIRVRIHLRSQSTNVTDIFV